jgi:hyperosmotically inducible periplasmic protein
MQDVVQLSGFVDSPAQKQQAEQIARGVNGVRSVRNNIVVRTG